jgi:hypothetical protein
MILLHADLIQAARFNRKNFYLAERAREENYIDERPAEERDEIRQIYAAKGFKGTAAGTK